MSDAKEAPSDAERIAIIEARRAARKADEDGVKLEQRANDLEAIDALEFSSGESLHTMTANGFAVGVPVTIAFRAPTGAQYKRYLDTYGKAAQKNDANGKRSAQELLAQSCWVYPVEEEKRKAVLEAFPGTLVSMAIEVAKVAELRSEEEGKG